MLTLESDIHEEMFIRLSPFPPARFVLEAASNCQSHLESVHQVPITAGWTEARCRRQGFYLIAPLLVLVLDGAFVLIIVRPTEKLPVTDRRTDSYF